MNLLVKKFKMDRLTRNRAIFTIDGERKIYVRSGNEENRAMQEENQVGDVSTGMEPNDESTDHEISIGLNNMTINNGSNDSNGKKKINYKFCRPMNHFFRPYA